VSPRSLAAVRPSTTTRTLPFRASASITSCGLG
jgi:hypothetical protein